jgi:hypothetical protein
MTTKDCNVERLLEVDRLVRLMAAASRASEIVAVVRTYLASWPKDRILQVQAAHAGWTPFDQYQRPFPILSARDVRQIRNSIRIRCRELEASGVMVEPELLELDLFLFFANESLDVHDLMREDIGATDTADNAWHPKITVVYGSGIAATPEAMSWR